MDKPVFEKGIPLPDKNQSRSKYHWLAEMEVGDSFLCPHQDAHAVRQLSYLARKEKSANWLPDGFKISWQKMEDGLYRVWRVA